MAQYRKKPVVIEAWQFIGFDKPYEPQPAWLHEAIDRGVIRYQVAGNPCYIIRTLEGDMRADLKDWIIQGVKGELYPYKPDIFDATYEPA